jgi:hypothetical protein
MQNFTDHRMSSDRVGQIVKELVVPEGISVSLGAQGKSDDGLSYQTVSISDGDGNGTSPNAVLGVRAVTTAFRNMGAGVIATRVDGGYDVRVLLEI